jgi:hypothetical protein
MTVVLSFCFPFADCVHLGNELRKPTSRTEREEWGTRSRIGAYEPGLKLTVSRVWVEAARPFIR